MKKLKSIPKGTGLIAFLFPKLPLKLLCRRKPSAPECQTPAIRLNTSSLKAAASFGTPLFGWAELLTFSLFLAACVYTQF
jgi:hypothetical protein